MSPVRAYIDALSGSGASPGVADLLLRPMRGVPVALWPVRALIGSIPLNGIRIVTADERLIALAGRHSLGVAPDLLEARRSGALIADPRQPLCSLESVRRALAAGESSLVGAQIVPIERLRIEDEATWQVAAAVAAGLPPDHPCVAGIARLRLPLGTSIRAIVSDVDGCLTDGGIAYAGSPEAVRTFNTHDGLGHHLLAQAGVVVGWLSATSNGASIERRAAQLEVRFVDAARGDKGPRFLELCRRMGVEPSETLYLGDDVNDLPAIALAGLSACPEDARPEVRAVVDLVLEHPGGRACFRELADIVLAGRPSHPLSS